MGASTEDDEIDENCPDADTEKSSYPDGGWGWVVALGSGFSHFLVVGLGRSFGLYYLVLLDKFQQSAAATSLVVALFNTIRQMLGPLAGFLVDRFTCRVVVFIGGVIMLVGCVISAFAVNLIYLYITFGVLTGIGSAMIFTPSYIIVGQYFDKKKGKAMGLATVGSGLGTVALAPIITALLHQYSFFGAMLIMGAIQFNNCVCASIFRPLPQWTHKKKKKVEQPIYKNKAKLMEEMKEIAADDNAADESAVTDSEQTKTSKTPKAFHILKNKTFILYGLQIVSMSICIQTFLTFLPGIAEEFGAEKSKAALLLSIVGVADMAGRFIWGFVFDLKAVRYRRRLFHALLGVPVGVFAILTGRIRSYVGFVVMSVLFGIVEGGFHSQRATIVSEFVAKDQMSSTVGFVICFQGVGNLLGPPIAGALRDITGTYSPSYYFCGSALAVVSTLFLLNYFWKSFRSKPDNPVV